MLPVTSTLRACSSTKSLACFNNMSMLQQHSNAKHSSAATNCRVEADALLWQKAPHQLEWFGGLVARHVHSIHMLLCN